jgi:spermidine/putrescine transport system substrate-binding protein
MRLLCWADYLAPAVLSRFEVETGIRVEGVWYRTDHECATRVTTGEAFDVVVATDYVAEGFRRAGLLRPLDMDRLSGFTGVTDARLRRPPHDPETDGHKYTSVLYFGSEGFAVRVDQIAYARSSWETLFDGELAGCIAMLDGAREVLAPALYLLGHGPNTTDRDALERATDMLVEQRRLVIAYDSDTPWRHIVDGTAVVHCWDGDVGRAISGGVSHARYLLPREGFTLWADSPCIPTSATDADAAHRFINFLLEPEVAAANADFSGYQPAVSTAEPLMKSLVQRSLRPRPEQIERGTFLADLGDTNAVYESCYRRVRGPSST